jgi:hypothetical protein
MVIKLFTFLILYNGAFRFFLFYITLVKSYTWRSQWAHKTEEIQMDVEVERERCAYKSPVQLLSHRGGRNWKNIVCHDTCKLNLKSTVGISPSDLWEDLKFLVL